MSGYTNARLGHDVIYVLSEQDVREIIQKRLQAGRGTSNGNDPREGEHYAATIVRDHHTEMPLPSTVGDIQWVVGAEHDGIDGPETTVKIVEWQVIHGLEPDGKWGPDCEEALKKDRLDAVSVNLQVFLDGNDSYWATSRTLFLPGKHGTITDEGYKVIDDGAEYSDIISNPEFWATDPKGHFYYSA